MKRKKVGRESKVEDRENVAIQIPQREAQEMGEGRENRSMDREGQDREKEDTLLLLVQHSLGQCCHLGHSVLSSFLDSTTLNIRIF